MCAIVWCFGISARRCFSLLFFVLVCRHGAFDHHFCFEISIERKRKLVVIWLFIRVTNVYVLSVICLFCIDARYPTSVAVLRCMDGRLDMCTLMNLPLGIVSSFQNLGGEFDLG